VHIRRIQVLAFRNLEPQTVELAPGVNLLIGGNGQGKTNLLEAIHLLSSLRSFRPAATREMIQHGQSRAEVGADLFRDQVPVSLKAALEGASRRLWIGQRAVGSVAEFMGQLSVVAFTPDDLAMIKGPPAGRRRFLDRAAFLFDARHLEVVKNFSTALRSRNRLLADGRPDRLQLESFSESLANWGSQVSAGRLALVERIRPDLLRLIKDLLGSDQLPELEFKQGWAWKDKPDQASLLEQLEANQGRDERRRTTTLGPQLDDFDVALSGASTRRFASQGQQRVAAVALLLSVVEQVVGSGAPQPVILLDDVSSELDHDVRARLFHRVRELGGQTLVTTTDESLVEQLRDGNERAFSVQAGRVMGGEV
jgi:DNA replication and repair protein RecF